MSANTFTVTLYREVFRENQRNGGGWDYDLDQPIRNDEPENLYNLLPVSIVQEEFKDIVGWELKEYTNYGIRDIVLRDVNDNQYHRVVNQNNRMDIIKNKVA